jgi:predicted nuclease of restriction endonuclease-like (RecB) superfamily
VKNSDTKYKHLLKEISSLVEHGRNNVVRHINTELLFTYWHVGRLIVEQELRDNIDEQSSRQLILELSKELSRKVGKGFSRSNLFSMRRFYQMYQSVQTVSGQISIKSGQTASNQIKKSKTGKITRKSKSVQTVSGQTKIGLTISDQLNWSHYCELLKCSNEMEISFYQQTAIHEGWSVRELRRQIDTALFERIALSKNAKSVMKLAGKGAIVQKDTDLIRDPYILEFLNIPEHHSYSEKQLEQRIIDNLQKFILELGKGFTFVARQFRITLNNKHYRVDLVFYHRILKCFVLIDLKIKSVEHSDIGQMNMYLNYFETEQNSEDDNPPVGIILTKHKDDITVEYAIRGITNKIFVSKYQLYLPDKKLLQRKVKSIIDSK